jgi:hypothetical protein
MFWLVLAFTPAWVIGNYLLAASGVALTNIGKWPWFQTVVGITAFMAWSLTVPETPFADHLLFISDEGISVQTGTIVMLATSFALGFLTTVARPAWQRFWAARHSTT